MFWASLQPLCTYSSVRINLCVLRSISIACWVVVFSPQIIQNFQRSSADALSIQFIIVWLVGDIFNILGAILQGVLPTMIILAIYYTLADIVLLAQCFYYRGFTWSDAPAQPKPQPQAHREPNERTDLLAGMRDREERRGSEWSALSPAVPHFPENAPPPPPPSAWHAVLWNSTAVLMVVAAGILGWFLGQRATSGKEGRKHHEGDTLELNFLGQFFGYLCAVAYIASRLPQLILNWRRKTTDGLSMLFFLFACLGNVTYSMSIFAYEPKCRESQCEPGEASHLYGRYMIVNLSWLIGALVTLGLDVGVFAQYFIYRNRDDDFDEDGDFPQDDRRPSYDERPLLRRDESTFNANGA